MKKIKTLGLIGILLIVFVLPTSNAHEKKVVDPGVTPDSFLWGLDKALDNLNLLLTINPAEKARKGIEIARERLEEVKVMAEENKLEAAEKGKEEQLKILSKVKKSISGIKVENATEQIEEEIEIEIELEEYEEEIKVVIDNLKMKIEVKGTLNEQQEAVLESILSTLEDKTDEIKIEIKNKKDKTKIRIKAETGKSESEINDEIGEIEEEMGLADLKKEKADEELEDAKEDLVELEKDFQEHKSEGHVADETPIITFMDNAKKRLADAEEAFKAKDFGEAFGQTNAAQQLIKNAKRVLEKTVEQFGEEEEHEMEEAREIDVEIEDGEAKIKVKVGDASLKFTMQTTDKNAIMQEIAARTGLSVEEVTKLAEFEEEKEADDKKGKEVKCKIGGCSGELCGEASFVDQVVTICLYKPEYACYKDHGRCGIQVNGQCGWTQTKELTECIKEKGKKEEKAKVEEENKDKEECIKKGGKWGMHGLSLEESCLLPASDVGKECLDSDECEGDCIAELSAEDKEKLSKDGIVYTKGKCSEWKRTYGCHAFVDNGRVMGILCKD